MQELIIRRAERRDLDDLVALFADDAIGGHGDTSDPAVRPLYEAAFEAIARQEHAALFAAEMAGAVVGTFQLVTERTLSSRGALKAQLLAVQVRADMRSRGIGAAMIARAIEEATAMGAKALSLTSNSQRHDAHRFYERLGFQRSHHGFRIAL